MEHQPDYAAAAGWLLCALITTLIFSGVVLSWLTKLERWVKRRYVYKLHRRLGSRLCVCGDPLFLHNADDTEPDKGWCVACPCTEFRPVD